MSTLPLPDAIAGAPQRVPALPAAAPILVGWLALYGPTYLGLAEGLWRNPGHQHEPLAGLVAAVGLVRLRGALADLPAPSRPLTGLAVLGLGLALALAGIGSANPTATMLSQLPLLAGLILILCGTRGLALAWFPVAYLIFTVPMPGIVLDALTGELRVWVSAWAEAILGAAGLPVARQGVVILVGPYRLLVADACSGLHSIISLAALGTLYLHLAGPWRPTQLAIMVASIAPIAALANLLRVLLVLLCTYTFGEAAGRTVHDLGGVAIFIVALVALIGLDALMPRRTPHCDDTRRVGS